MTLSLELWPLLYILCHCCLCNLSQSAVICLLSQQRGQCDMSEDCRSEIPREAHTQRSMLAGKMSDAVFLEYCVWKTMYWDGLTFFWPTKKCGSLSIGTHPLSFYWQRGMWEKNSTLAACSFWTHFTDWKDQLWFHKLIQSSSTYVATLCVTIHNIRFNLGKMLINH